MNDRDDLPLCEYCGEQEAGLQIRDDGARRAARYRGRPCCPECRSQFEGGSRPKPQRPTRAGGSSRNGRSERQRFPVEADCGWDDVVRAIEESSS